MKRFVSVFWGGKQNGGMFCNSNDAFSVAGAAHALTIRHCRRGLVLGEITLAGQNEAPKAVRRKSAKDWIESRPCVEGDIFHLIDINQKLRYGMIICVGESRGKYDN
jgi:hypothetical protein